MIRRRQIVIIAVLAIGSACHKDNSRNSALEQDLNLANQRDSSARFDSLSAAERGSAPNAATTHERSSSTASAREPASHAPTSGSAGRSGNIGGSSRTSSGSTPAPTSSSGATSIQRNTKRDAAIGAGAGAVVGGVTHGIKGGVIGAVVGGVVGGVIGNNVDIKKKKKKSP